MSNELSVHRNFLKYFGLSIAEITFAAAIDSKKETVKASLEP